MPAPCLIIRSFVAAEIRDPRVGRRKWCVCPHCFIGLLHDAEFVLPCGKVSRLAVYLHDGPALSELHRV